MHLRGLFVGLFTTLTEARLLEVRLFDTASSTLNLGGGSTISSSGAIYRLDGGQWKQGITDGDRAPCGSVCSKELAIRLPDADNNYVFVCNDNIKQQCVPGGSYRCHIRYGDIQNTFDSYKTHEFSGFGVGLSTFCGGNVAEINI